MALELWTSGDLYSILRDDRLDPVPSYFLDTFFTEQYFSEDKEILFSNLPVKDRKLAPFVLPTEQGKPIFGVKGETVRSFTPPYIKPKDAVRPTDARTRRPSEILSGRSLSLAERFDQRVVEVMEYHHRAIRMQIAWMAARAFIDGKVVVKFDRDSGSPYPEVTIDFGRSGDHTITLTNGYWNDPNADILGDLEDWIEIVRQAEYGGNVTQVIVGSAVAGVFRRNVGIKDMLDTTYRGGESVSIDRGILRRDEPMAYIGRLGANLEVFTYKDQVQNDDGSMVDILDPRDVLLVAPGATGIQAYGAIYDVDALQSGQALQTDIFPKMFKTDDPGELFIMNQSSPLPIPLYPNRTLKARVLT